MTSNAVNNLGFWTIFKCGVSSWYEAAKRSLLKASIFSEKERSLFQKICALQHQSVGEVSTGKATLPSSDCQIATGNGESNHSIISVTCQLVKRVSERIRFLTYSVLSYFEALGSQSLQREREPLVKILQFWDQSVWEVSTGKAMLLSSRCTKWQRVMAKVKIQL